MTKQFQVVFLGAFFGMLLGGVILAQVAGVPKAKIVELEAALMATKDDGLSPARERLAVKRVIRDAEAVLGENKAAENRFEVMGVMFRAQQILFGLDDSAKNRAEILETAKALMEAPDAYAGVRLDADLLLTQSELVRKGADARGRLAAMNEMVERYQGTSGEARMLRTAMVMALEVGDPLIIRDLREAMEERFAADFEMINFQREKLGGQVFGAPICGVFKRSDGSVMHLPADGMGRTIYLYFWSQDDAGSGGLEGLAAYWKANGEAIAGRVHIVSMNVDGLPDAGEKILRDLGVDWPALHLPKGRENQLYQIFAKRDGALVTVTPTGYAAIVMEGSTRQRTAPDGPPDFARIFGSLLAREWTKEESSNQLTSIFAGDFLVVDAGGAFDPVCPPEVKIPGNGVTLKAGADSVPEEELQGIQECFVLPPLRYRLSLAEVRDHYRKAERLCAKAIESHPKAGNLWIVRNRRMVALTGLWKLTMDPGCRVLALKEAELALAGDLPAGAEVISKLVLARESLRQDGADQRRVINDFVESSGGLEAPASALAAASLMALEVADRELHENYRSLILGRHIEDPAMWTFGSFLLDRHHRYWLYRVPFVAGWTYGRRQGHFMAMGTPDEVNRSVEAEFKTLEGTSVQLPLEHRGKWSVVVFCEDWEEAGKSLVYSTVGRYLLPSFEKRGLKDVVVSVAVLGADVARLKSNLEAKPMGCEVLVVPGGVGNPVVRELGVLVGEGMVNVAVFRPDGTLAISLSGLTMSRAKENVVENVLEWQDGKSVVDLLEKGELEKAKEMIFALAPPFDPKAVDSRGRPLKKPKISLSHLRARARVYLAMKEWDLALADAEEVAIEQMAVEGWMSLRTRQLDEDEAFRDRVKARKGE